jgi:hypothetical protein
VRGVSGYRKGGRGRTGFSLIELLVTAVLTAAAAMAIVAAITGGLRVWERSRTLGAEQRDRLIALETLERDVRNALRFRPIPFEGAGRAVTLPGLLPAVDAEGQRYQRIGAVRYALDSRGQALTRKTWAYPLPEPPGAGEVLMPRVLELRFDYLDGRTAGQSWLPSWRDPTNRPRAMRVVVVEGQGKNRVETQRTIVLPCP